MYCAKCFNTALSILAALMLSACATAPLLVCSKEETAQWGKQNTQAIANGGSFYPEASVKAKETGIVKVAVDFLAADFSHQASLFESSGHAALDDAAVNRLKTANLAAPVCGGKNFPVRVIMPMAFDLKEG